MLYRLLLPRVKQPKELPKTNRSKEIIVDPGRLATCLDRSAAASGAIASMVSPCLPWRKLLSLTERLPLVERGLTMVAGELGYDAANLAKVVSGKRRLSRYLRLSRIPLMTSDRELSRQSNEMCS